MEKKHGTENLERVLLEEVIKSHLLADPKTIPEIRDSEDCCQGSYISSLHWLGSSHPLIIKLGWAVPVH